MDVISPSIHHYLPGSTATGSIENSLLEHQRIMSSLKHSIEVSKQKMVTQANKHRLDKHFAVGDFVYLRLHNSRTDSNGDPEVLVQWEKHRPKEATWENLTSLRQQFPDLDYIGDNKIAPSLSLYFPSPYSLDTSAIIGPYKVPANLRETYELD
ncbi:ty3-gypsy retrotransposon protein [Tanacetum coccineum]